MFYIFLTATVVITLVLIFRDDHDNTYDRNGDTRPVDKPGTNTKHGIARQTSEEKIPARFPVSSTPERELSWTYLYSLKYVEDICGDTMETEITGMRYYCTLSDIGPVNGTVRPEPENPHDTRAQVVIRADGKKLGYIPRYALDEYEEFNEDNLVCPFAGKVRVDPNGFIHADILVALPESLDFVKEELSGYLEML